MFKQRNLRRCWWFWSFSSLVWYSSYRWLWFTVWFTVQIARWVYDSNLQPWTVFSEHLKISKLWSFQLVSGSSGDVWFAKFISNNRVWATESSVDYHPVWMIQRTCCPESPASALFLLEESSAKSSHSLSEAFTERMTRTIKKLNGPFLIYLSILKVLILSIRNDRFST